MLDKPIYIFDAYGTLLDLSAAARKQLSDHPNKALLLAEVWRGRQLEYAWTDMALGRSTDFWDATVRALDSALVIAGLDNDASLRERLLEAYGSLDAYGDATDVVARLNGMGAHSLTFSNASKTMLRKSLAASGLDRVLQGAVSVDDVGVYKPNPEAYSHIARHLGIDSGAAFFVSSNPWDAAGAAHAGFKAIWVNRQGIQYPFDRGSLHAELRSLSELPL
jgi:2-haloacid dehalogenase